MMNLEIFSSKESETFQLEEVNLYNLNGEKISTYNSDVQIIDLSEYAKGMYLIEFILEDGSTLREKIILE